jgi:hypothetical protein
MALLLNALRILAVELLHILLIGSLHLEALASLPPLPPRASRWPTTWQPLNEISFDSTFANLKLSFALAPWRRTAEVS